MPSSYSTTDLGLASAIIASGFPLDHIEKHNGRGAFFFVSSHALSQFADDYFLGKTRVDPLGYFGAMKSLKTYLYNTRV